MFDPVWFLTWKSAESSILHVETTRVCKSTMFLIIFVDKKISQTFNVASDPLVGFCPLAQCHRVWSFLPWQTLMLHIDIRCTHIINNWEVISSSQRSKKLCEKYLLLCPDISQNDIKNWQNLVVNEHKQTKQNMKPPNWINFPHPTCCPHLF